MKYLFALLSLFFYTSSAWPISIKLVNKDGMPVENAVVSVASAESNKAQQRVATMDQLDRQFVPHVLTIEAGQRVRFPNSDNIRHHVYSFSEPKTFEIRMFKGGESETLIFDKPGIVVLGCNIHDQMVGYIYVADNEKTYISNSQGIVNIETSVTEVSIWHSRLSDKKTDVLKVFIDPNLELQELVLPLVNMAADTRKKTFGSKFSSPGKW